MRPLDTRAHAAGDSGCGCSPKSCVEFTHQFMGQTDSILPDGAAGSGVGSSTLGNFTFTFEEHYAATPLGASVIGRETLTFEDGSTIEETYAGFSTNEGTFVENIKIVGGTGRFEGAQGAAVQWGIAVLNEAGFAFTSAEEGQICGRHLDE